MTRNLYPAVALLVAAGVASAFPVPGKPAAETLVTRTYDLTPVLGSKLSSGIGTDTEAVARLILENIRIGELRPNGNGPQLVERDGGKLEVRATEKVQGEVKDLLDALARLADVAVDVKADLVEFDRAAFEKDVRPLLKPAKGTTESPVIFPAGPGEDEQPGAKTRPSAEAVDRVVKTGKVVQSSTGRHANGSESLVSARQAVFTYYDQQVVGSAPTRPPLSGKEGYRLGALVVVSGDRRVIRMRLSEQAVAVVGMKKRPLGQVGGKPIVGTSPDVSEFGKAATVEIPDGGAVLFRLDYAPKDKVWVLVLRPTIFIQAEENARKQQEKK